MEEEEDSEPKERINQQIIEENRKELEIFIK